MKKKLVLGTMGGILLCGNVGNVFAYSIWSPVQYVKQLFVTPNGSSDQSKATIKIDGTNGNISSKSLSVAGKVGIGTTDPQAKLSILESPSNPNSPNTEKEGLHISKSGLRKNISVGLGIDTLGNAGLELKGQNVGYIDFGTSSNIDYNGRIAYNEYVKGGIEFIGNKFGFLRGNVGIGTTDPQAKLDVNGDIAINGVKTIQMKTKTIRLRGSIKKYYPVIIHFDGPNFYNKIVITAKPRRQLTNTPNAEGNKCNNENCYDYRHSTNIYINYEGLTNARGITSHFVKKDWFDNASDVKECRLTDAGKALMCYMAGNRHYSIHGTFSSIDIYYTPGDHRKSCHYGEGYCGDYDNNGNGKGPKNQRLDYHTVYSR